MSEVIILELTIPYKLEDLFDDSDFFDNVVAKKICKFYILNKFRKIQKGYVTLKFEADESTFVRDYYTAEDIGVSFLTCIEEHFKMDTTDFGCSVYKKELSKMPKMTVFMLLIPNKLKCYFRDYNKFFNNVITPKIGSFILLNPNKINHNYYIILKFEVIKNPFVKSYSNLIELCELFKDYAIEYYHDKLVKSDLTCWAYTTYG